MTTPTKAALLAAGDIPGLLALNKELFGDARMAKGYNALGDIVATTDGVSLDGLWTETQQVVATRNAQRSRWVNLLTYPIRRASDQVIQFGDTSGLAMELASEYGVPQGVRPDATFTSMAAKADWWDTSVKFTWRALADMSSEQVAALTNLALELDNRKVYELVMGQVFRPTNVEFSENGQTLTAYTFYNADGTVPPSYNGNSFAGSHTHFRISGAAAITSGDLDEILLDLKSHGFSAENGTTLVLLANPIEAAIINTFRTSTGAAEDFVPAAGARFYTPDHLLGEQPAKTWGGYAVKGGYGELLIIEDSRVPAGYIVGLASGGDNVPTNAIMLREHPKLTGLQIIPGPNDAYPLSESYFAHYVGTGVRQRGAGLVMQIKASGSYAPPASLVI